MFFLIIFFISFFNLHILRGAPGCMDNSLHAYACNDGKICAQKPYDTKTLHYVPCSCPCSYEVIDRRLKCLKCWHYRDARFLMHTYNIEKFEYIDKMMGLIFYNQSKEKGIYGE